MDQKTNVTQLHHDATRKANFILRCINRSPVCKTCKYSLYFPPC